MVLALTACESETKQKPGPPAPVVAKEAALEIAKQPLTPMAAKTNFLELTIDLPAAASMPRKGDTKTSWDFKDSALVLELTEVNTMPTQDGWKDGPQPQKHENVTRTVTDEPGAYWVFDRKNDATGFRAQHCRDLDPKQPPSGICEVTFKSPTPVVDLDKVIAFASRVCPSIKLTNRTVPAPATGSGT